MSPSPKPRRRLLTLGDSLVGVGMVAAAVMLPSGADLARRGEPLREVASAARQEAGLLKQQSAELRPGRWAAALDAWRSRASALAKRLGSPADAAKLRQTADALGAVAEGLERSASTWEPSGAARLADGLAGAAGLLESLGGPARQRADELQKVVAELGKAAEALSGLGQSVPAQWKAVRDTAESLGAFEAGLGKVDLLLDADKLAATRSGLAGMKKSIDATKKAVETLGSYGYPTVEFQGLKPKVGVKPFWPDAGTVAEGLAETSTALEAAEAQADELAKGLPALRGGVEAARKTLTSTRTALRLALEQQPAVESAAVALPRALGRVGETLPKLAADWKRALDAAEGLRPIASGLRQGSEALRKASADLPAYQKSLRASASLLRAAQADLQAAGNRPEEVRAWVEGSREAAELFADGLPALAEAMGERLVRQEQAFAAMESGLEKLEAAWPGRSDWLWLDAAKWLLGLAGVWALVRARLGGDGRS